MDTSWQRAIIKKEQDMSQDQFPQNVVRFEGNRPVKQSADDRPLAFVHINKAAGTSFTRYLASHFPNPSDIAPPYFGDFSQVRVDDPNVRLYWGHFPVAQWTKQRKDTLMLTFLRDPVQRIVSQYKSLQNPENAKGGWDKVLNADARDGLQFAQQASLAEFAMSDREFILGHTRDLQTRFLSSFPSPDHPRFLSSAMENLEQLCLFFGITEFFEASIRLFRFQLNSRRPYCSRTHRCNVSRDYPADLNDDRLMDRMRELTTHDSELYRFAIELFHQRCKNTLQSDTTEHGPENQAKVA